MKNIITAIGFFASSALPLAAQGNESGLSPALSSLRGFLAPGTDATAAPNPQLPRLALDLYRAGSADCAALLNDPQNAGLNLKCGRDLADVGDSPGAIAYLENALALETQNSRNQALALHYLGRCYFVVGEYDKSRKAFADSANMGAGEDFVSGARRYQYFFGYDDFFSSWDSQESEHFVFHFQTPSVVKDQARFIKAREDACANITSFFNGVKLPYKIAFFVWNSRESAMQNAGFSLGFAVPPVNVIHSNFDQTTGHEPAHIISSYFSGFADTSMFINEGIAVYLNQAGQNHLEAARKFLKLHPEVKISIKAVWANKTLPSEYYSLAGAFVTRLLEKGGKEKLLALIRRQSYAEAAEIYGAELDKMIGEFETELTSQQTAGAHLPG